MEAREVQVSLSRDLSFFDITMIGIAGMIGAGIFALTGIAAGIAGPAILLAFFLNGIIATLTGLAYAELGSAIPQAGGGYLWIKEAMGDYAGFMAGWIDWAAHTIACALYAVTFGAFFAEMVVHFIGIAAPAHLLSKISALAMVSFLAYVNYKGAKESGKLGGMVTLLKVLILVVFALFGIYRMLTYPDWMDSYRPFMPTGISGILAAMGLTFIAFEGFEIIVQSGEEVKDPERNIPKAIVVSLWVAVGIYILVAFSLLGAVKADVPSWMYLGRLAELSLVRVADTIMPLGGWMILAGGLISTVSAMNATIYSSSRVVFALSRSGYLTRALSRINEKTRTPHYAIFFSYVIVAVASLAPIETVASAASLMFLYLFLSVNVALVVLRLRRPDIKRTFSLPLVPVLPLIAIVFQIIIAYFLISQIEHGLTVFLMTAVWMFFGSLVYYAYSEKELEKREEEEVMTVFKEIPIDKKKFVVLVPIANPVIAKKLVRFAELIARQRDGEVVVMNTVKLPIQTPISTPAKDVKNAKEMVEKLMNLSVPAGGVVTVSHNIAEAILTAVDEWKADMIVMGWRGRTFRRDVVLGSTIDPILMKAKCDVVVVRFEPGEKMPDFKRILIPTVGGPHAKLACEIARDIAAERKAKIKLLYVGTSEKEMEKADLVFKEAIKELEGLNVETEFDVSRSPSERIAREAENFDLTIIGASEKTFLHNFLLGLFPEKVARKTSRTVAMTRKWVRII
ncbi:amino acid permease [Archaeoglobus neptunius]|uniref:amino acid permease n=1 Tax=Archaeoglobus neptunius TaxID=2798580 RepID=UPI001928819C|nr:amino acid permease [Archaeoglobus neptunius]